MNTVCVSLIPVQKVSKCVIWAVKVLPKSRFHHNLDNYCISGYRIKFIMLDLKNWTIIAILNDKQMAIRVVQQCLLFPLSLIQWTILLCIIYFRLNTTWPHLCLVWYNLSDRSQIKLSTKIFTKLRLNLYIQPVWLHQNIRYLLPTRNQLWIPLHYIISIFIDFSGTVYGRKEIWLKMFEIVIQLI